MTPFLSVNGAGDAIDFYKKAFGAEERGRMPGPGGRSCTAKSRLRLVVMVADAIMGPPTAASIHLYVDDVDAAWTRAIAAGAGVVMPLADQFWGDRYGVLSDKWGNRWSMATHKEDLSPKRWGSAGRGDEEHASSVATETDELGVRCGAAELVPFLAGLWRA